MSNQMGNSIANRWLRRAFSGMFATIALLAATVSQASPDGGDVAGKGSLVIIGGAVRFDNAPVWEKIVELAGGKGARIAVFASASANPERVGQALIANLKRYGADAFFVPVAVKLKQPDYRQAANDSALAEQVRTAGGAYFAGGDQGRITQALVAPDGSKTAVLQALWDMYRGGGVIAGSSAGAAIMSSTMFHDAKAVLPTLQLGVTDGQEIAPGLGFIGDRVFIDQHLIIRGRFARMIPLMQKKNYQLGLGVDENTALVVTKQSEVEVIGYKGVIVMDLSHATTDSKMKGFNISNARISYLDSGDHFNLVSKVMSPARDKLDGKLEVKLKNQHDKPRFYGDILGNTTALDVMVDLVDGGGMQAIGLTFGGPGSPRARQGFEFTFSKTADSVGYYSSASGAEAYTVAHIRLDVRPVVMVASLYRHGTN